jgi:hypothetical protein
VDLISLKIETMETQKVMVSVYTRCVSSAFVIAYQNCNGLWFLFQV